MQINVQLSFIILVLVYLVYRVLMVFKEQQDFEEKVTQEWNNMSKEEKLASGRQNKYC